MPNEKAIHSDQHYITGLSENQQDTIQEIYRRFYPRIQRYVLQNSGKEVDAADIFQEAMVAIFQRVRKGGFKLSCPFEAYLLVICRNLWINELKKRRRQEVTNQEAALYEDEAVEQLSAETELDQARDRFFWQKFKDLGPSCQDILKHSWTGISLQEVAAKLDVSYQYLRKKKSECVKRLMELVRKDPVFTALKY